jgi:APA family basic amino acid/polyamine antiporter
MNSIEAEFTRVLNYNDLVLSNLGYIIGVGIFVLLGKTLNIAGSSAWISVLLSGIVIYLVSNAYVKVHNEYKANNSEILAITDKFGKFTGNIAVWVTLIMLIFIAYVAILAFGDYFEAFSNFRISSSIAGVLGLLSTVAFNIYGINMTVSINSVITTSSLVGLGIIIVLGVVYMFNNARSVIANFKNIKNSFNIPDVIYGAFIFIFAYTGFEMIIRLNNESIDGDSDIPDAIHDSIWITIFIYMACCLIMIGVFDSHMTVSNRPFVDLIERLTTNKYIIKYIDYCGVALTWTTILFSITQASRILREYAASNEMNTLSEINRTTHTPINCIIVVTLALIGLLMMKFKFMSGAIVANAGLILIMILVYFSSL